MTKKVLVFGTFDLLHPGHISFLEQAKMHGDELYVVIARDKTVEKIKGITPEQDENKRKNNIEQLPFVTKAVFGNTDNYYVIIEEIKPDIICLGYDQNEMELKEELKKRNLHPQMYRLNPYRPEQYKSSIMKKRAERRKE